VLGLEIIGTHAEGNDDVIARLALAAGTWVGEESLVFGWVRISRRVGSQTVLFTEPAVERSHWGRRRVMR